LSTLNTGISLRVCVEGEKVCRHDTSVQNYRFLEQWRPHDTILYWHDPAVVGALPFKYTESIVCSVSTALHGNGTVLVDEDLKAPPQRFNLCGFQISKFSESFIGYI
jgi:hypothetical protein